MKAPLKTTAVVLLAEQNNNDREAEKPDRDLGDRPIRILAADRPEQHKKKDARRQNGFRQTMGEGRMKTCHSGSLQWRASAAVLIAASEAS